MSGSLCFEINYPRRYIKGGTSSEINAIEKLFGEYPITLDEKQIPQLKAMMVVYEYKPNVYKNIIEAIEKYGSIRLDVEY